jgi:hypothetical protein
MPDEPTGGAPCDAAGYAAAAEAKPERGSLTMAEHMTTPEAMADLTAATEPELLREQITECERLLASPMLVLAVRGGGLEGDERSIHNTEAVLIRRLTIECILQRLRNALDKRA